MKIEFEISDATVELICIAYACSREDICGMFKIESLKRFQSESVDTLRILKMSSLLGDVGQILKKPLPKIFQADKDNEQRHRDLLEHLNANYTEEVESFSAKIRDMQAKRDGYESYEAWETAMQSSGVSL